VIDATDRVTCVHPNHDYSHHPGNTAGVYKGPEAVRNESLLGGPQFIFSALNATHVLGPSGIRRRRDLNPFASWPRPPPCIPGCGLWLQLSDISPPGGASCGARVAELDPRSRSEAQREASPGARGSSGLFRSALARRWRHCARSASASSPTGSGAGSLPGWPDHRGWPGRPAGSSAWPMPMPARWGY
jgi:hypothetical protein